jgi:hypothetical protein
MTYAYPAPRTGTAQDLMRVITLAAERGLVESGAELPRKSEFARRWIEPFFRAVGVAISWLLEIVPADWTIAFHQRLFASLAAPYSYPFDPAAPALLRARALAAELRLRTGREPALLALISHPPVMGELAHMNLELVRHATLALRAVRGAPCRPRLVTAIDPFALDTLPISSEGLYAGFMGTFHLGIDRLAHGRGHPGTWLTPDAAWSAMSPRLFSKLGRGGEVGLVLSGGVPSTGRVLYGAREWTRSARRSGARRARPVEAEAALRADPAFAAFEKSALELPGRTGAWRRFEMWLMAAAAGLIPGLAPRAAAESILGALDVPAAERPGLLADLEADLTRETPRRLRLFRLLAGRVARRRPLVLIPIVHSTEPLGISVREAWSWEAAPGGQVAATRADAPGVARTMTPDAFADLFVEENFR